MCIMEKFQNMKAFIGSALEYSRHHTEKTSSSLQRHLQVKNSIHVFRISSGGIMSCKYIQLWITCRLLLVLMWMSLFLNCSRNIIWYFLQHMTSCVSERVWIHMNPFYVHFIFDVRHNFETTCRHHVVFQVLFLFPFLPFWCLMFKLSSASRS